MPDKSILDAVAEQVGTAVFPIPLNACRVTRPYLLERAGIPAESQNPHARPRRRACLSGMRCLPPCLSGYRCGRASRAQVLRASGTADAPHGKMQAACHALRKAPHG